MPKNKKHDKLRDTVIVVGGGWSGLAAAVELVRHQIPVILIESAKQLGGRARSVHIDELRVDNGQHMLLGAYESTLDLLRLIGIRESDVFKRQTLSLQWLISDKKSIALNAPKLPAPFHLAWALLTAKGLPINDRLAALKFSQQLKKQNFSIDRDCSVKSLLKNNHQSDLIIKAIWEPLCLGALNTQIDEASAQIFLRALKESFRYARKDSDLLLTRRDLGSILPEPASDYIERHNGNVRLGQRVTSLNISNKSITGISTAEGSIDARYVVLATPSTVTMSLFEAHPALNDISTQLQHIEHRPICTVYLQYPKHVKLGRWLRGSLNTITQWVFDRRLYGQKGLMAVVISSNGNHMDLDNEKLCEIVEKELASHFPHWPKPVTQHVIREKRATFASTVGINQYRPEAHTAVNGLWLAGDYTNVGLPGTLEGAIRSGLRCAQQIITEQLDKK